MWSAEFDGNDKSGSDNDEGGWADFDDGSNVTNEPVKKDVPKQESDDDFGDFGEAPATQD